MSRKITPDALKQLIRESLLLGSHISKGTVIDAGSGNGILGLSLAIDQPHRAFVLVEPVQKKVAFLESAIRTTGSPNASVQAMDIGRYFFTLPKQDATVIARGFPRPDALIKYLKKECFQELLIITSRTKLKKIQIMIENLPQNTYNIPLRDTILILKINNVSRETLRTGEK